MPPARMWGRVRRKSISSLLVIAATVVSCDSEPPTPEASAACGIGPDCQVSVLVPCPRGVRIDVPEAQARACLDEYGAEGAMATEACLGTECRTAETCEGLRDWFQQTILDGRWKTENPCMVEQTEISARECLQRECGF